MDIEISRIIIRQSADIEDSRFSGRELLQRTFNRDMRGVTNSDADKILKSLWTAEYATKQLSHVILDKERIKNLSEETKKELVLMSQSFEKIGTNQTPSNLIENVSDCKAFVRSLKEARVGRELKAKKSSNKELISNCNEIFIEIDAWIETLSIGIDDQVSPKAKEH